MKKLLIIGIILMLVKWSFSQNDSLLNALPMKEGKVYYSEIVFVDSIKMAKLYPIHSSLLVLFFPPVWR